MKYIILTLVCLVAIGGAFFASRVSANVITQGIIPKVVSTTVMPVGPLQALTLVATSSACTGRVISTASTSVMLSFQDGFTPTITNSKGSWQAASTTISYDNANFGCGAISAVAYASSSVTVTTLAQ